MRVWRVLIWSRFWSGPIGIKLRFQFIRVFRPCWRFWHGGFWKLGRRNAQRKVRIWGWGCCKIERGLWSGIKVYGFWGGFWTACLLVLSLWPAACRYRRIWPCVLRIPRTGRDVWALTWPRQRGVPSDRICPGRLWNCRVGRVWEEGALWWWDNP